MYCLYQRSKDTAADRQKFGFAVDEFHQSPPCQSILLCAGDFIYPDWHLKLGQLKIEEISLIGEYLPVFKDTMLDRILWSWQIPL